MAIQVIEHGVRTMAKTLNDIMAIASLDSCKYLRTRVSQPPGKYGLLVPGQLDNDPKTYEKVMFDINSGKWFKAMRSEMDSMSSNKVWTSADPPKSFKPIGYKWVYKQNLRTDGEPVGFISIGEEQVVCRLHRKINGRTVMFLVLYMDDILLIGNDAKMLGATNHDFLCNSP
ncbi:UNVERIFIED_CONTAM: hypothetical protein Scaly_2421200 [Sesamum calycinum]|uniref:Reverse transcriptase Ty1/copia-type domain-containing protein n=1 Tax=Sesamum calycinum TaxID=2727403 RepID=A0AAW2M010_9LAMI